MTDKNKKDPAQLEKDQRGADPEQAEPKTRPLTADDIRELNGKLTIAGEPVPIDEQGAIKMDALSSFQLNKITDAIVDSLISANWNNLDDARQALRDGIQVLKKATAFLEELGELKPYLTEELKKAEYHGMTLEYILQELEPADVAELLDDPDSYLSAAIEEARKTKAAKDAITRQLQDGRKLRREQREKAEAGGAIMEVKNGNLTLFSSSELWDAFKPGRFSKMGEASKNFINEKTGEVAPFMMVDGKPQKLETQEGSAFDVSIKALALISAIMENSVDNVQADFVKDGKLKFYVKGVLDKYTKDTRRLFGTQAGEQIEGQIDITGKTAEAIYLENLFAPMLGYIGTTPNGSRWTVFGYDGYDITDDTMTVRSPYLYQYWRLTQGEYFERQKVIEEKREQNKKTNRKENAPLKLNRFFKEEAFLVDDAVLEIAAYITTAILQTGGKKGEEKKTEISYKRLIAECPRFNKELDDITEKIEKYRNGEPVEENAESDPRGKSKSRKSENKNPYSLYNFELKKIKKAFDLILDRERCAFLDYYEIVDLQPAHVGKNGNTIFEPPTKKKLNDKFILKWSKKQTADE